MNNKTNNKKVVLKAGILAALLCCIGLNTIVTAYYLNPAIMIEAAPAVLHIGHELHNIEIGIKIYNAGWHLLLKRAFYIHLQIRDGNSRIFYHDGYRCLWTCQADGGVIITWWHEERGSGQMYLPPSEVPPGTCPTC